MPVVLVCSACGKKWKVPKGMADRTSRCPGCSASLRALVDTHGTTSSQLRGGAKDQGEPSSANTTAKRKIPHGRSAVRGPTQRQTRRVKADRRLVLIPLLVLAVLGLVSGLGLVAYHYRQRPEAVLTESVAVGAENPPAGPTTPANPDWPADLGPPPEWLSTLRPVNAAPS